MAPDSAAARLRVAAHRQRLRRQGLRPVQVWIPDTRTVSFAERAHQDSVAVGSSPMASSDQGFIDSVSELVGL
jgi:hypothetical protein